MDKNSRPYGQSNHELFGLEFYVLINKPSWLAVLILMSSNKSEKDFILNMQVKIIINTL